MAVRYALGRWEALRASVMTGIEIDNYAADERCGSCSGRKNFLLRAPIGGGENAAAIYSLVGSAKPNGIDSRKLSTESAVPHRGSSDQSLRGVAPWNIAASLQLPNQERHRRRRRHERSHQQSPELPYIEEPIEHGGISIGIIPPLRECIAVAHEGAQHASHAETSELVNLWHSCCSVWISPSPTPKKSSPTRLTPLTRNAHS